MMRPVVTTEDKLFELFIIQLQILRAKNALIALYNYYGYAFSTDLSNFDAIKFVNISKEIVDNESDPFDDVDTDKLFEHFLEFEKTKKEEISDNKCEYYKLSHAINESDISLYEFLFDDIIEVKKKVMKSIINYDKYEFHNKLLDVIMYGEGIECKFGEH